MNFITPTAFIFSLLLPVLILLYLLKLKRKKRVVPAVWLWQRAINDAKANRPFQKLQRNILLLLQLLLLLFLIFALARPFFMSEKLPSSNIVVVLDISASMNATDVGQTRFESAREKCEAVIDGLDQDQKLMLITAGKSANVITGFSDDKLALKNRLKSIKPVDTPSKLKEAVVLAISLLNSVENGEIYIFSDKGTEELADIEHANIPINYVSIGKTSENIAITALDVRYNPITNLDFQVFVAVNNFFDQPKRFNLELYVDDNLVDVTSLELSANSRKAQIFELGSLFQGGLVDVKLDVADKLSVDNQAYSFIPKNLKKKVLLVSSGNFFLEKALNVDPNLEIYRINPSTFSDFDTSEFETIIFDRFSPEQLPVGNYIFIHALPPNLTVSEYVETPTIIDWENDHSILRFINLADVAVAKSMKINGNEFLKPLLFAEKSDLIWTYDDGKIKSIIIGFDLFDSNFPLKVSFPIFISNSIHWLSQNNVKSFRGNINTGETYKIYPPQNAKQVEIQLPNSDKIDLSREQIPIHFQQTDLAGLYKIDFGDSTAQFVANLLNEEESNIQPETSLSLGDKTIEAQSGALATKTEIWRYLAFLAIIILLAEWYFYHKKPI